jgi:hypothetical protein
VTLATRVDGVVTELAEPQSFEVVPLHLGKLPPADRVATEAFHRETARLQRAVLGAQRAANEAATRLDFLTAALDATPGADPALATEARDLRARLADLRIDLLGDPTLAGRNEPQPPSILERVQQIVSGSWTSTAAPTATHRESRRVAAEQFAAWLPKLTTLIEVDLAGLEASAEAAGAPWTPGRVPRWPSK